MELNSYPFADHENSVIANEKYFKAPEFKQKDDEENTPRKNSRVGSIHAGIEGDERASVSRQLELEAEHAIKYRTCSWQKVSWLPS